MNKEEGRKLFWYDVYHLSAPPILCYNCQHLVKKVVHSLLETLKREKLVLDWRKKQQARANVYITVRDMLHNGLPSAYTQELSRLKCEEVYQHIYDSYYGQGQSVYAKAS